METKIQIPESLLPMIKQVKRKYRLSTKEAFLFLMGYNTPAQKKLASTQKRNLFAGGIIHLRAFAKSLLFLWRLRDG